eukprot:TRINITY_DN38992_c0_g1_i1.p1 TRINITY_DN38992_c0_g1~~TRINITY_DN38992_c0_g1_i1.p1  ORF type:complete len:498 (+),score=36.16 TRINITY_DN38992_c0_g1_i1:297-1790(+)
MTVVTLNPMSARRLDRTHSLDRSNSIAHTPLARQERRILRRLGCRSVPGVSDEDATVLRHNSAPAEQFVHLPAEGESEELAAAVQAVRDSAWKRLQVTKLGQSRAAALQIAERCESIAAAVDKGLSFTHFYEMESGGRGEEGAEETERRQETSAREYVASCYETTQTSAQTECRTTALVGEGSSVGTRSLGSSAKYDNSTKQRCLKESASLSRHSQIQRLSFLQKQTSEGSQLASVSVPFLARLPSSEHSLSTSAPILKSASCHDYTAVLALQSDGQWKLTNQSPDLRSRFLLNHLASTRRASSFSSPLSARSCSPDCDINRHRARRSLTSGSPAATLQESQLKRWHLRESEGSLSLSAGSSPLIGTTSSVSSDIDSCTSERCSDSTRPPLPRSASARHVRQYSWSVGDREKDEHASALLWEALEVPESDLDTCLAGSGQPEEVDQLQQETSLPSAVTAVTSRPAAGASRMKPWDKLWPSLMRRPPSHPCAKSGSRR